MVGGGVFLLFEGLFFPVNFLAQILSFLFISLSLEVIASRFKTVTYPENEGVSAAFQIEKKKR